MQFRTKKLISMLVGVGLMLAASSAWPQSTLKEVMKERGSNPERRSCSGKNLCADGQARRLHRREFRWAERAVDYLRHPIHAHTESRGRIYTGTLAGLRF